MSINFTTIFRDSLNFIRNQPVFFGQLSLFFTFETLIFNYLMSQNIPINVPLTSNQMDFSSIQVPNILIAVIIVHLLLNVGLESLSILGIQQISQQNKIHWQTLFIRLFQRIGGLLLLMTLVLIPLFLTFPTAYLVNTSPLFVLVGLVLGLVIFVRLNLSFIDYLISHHTIKQSLQYTYTQGIQRNGTLVIYALLEYVFFPLFASGIVKLAGGNFLFAVLLIMVSRGIYVFSIIFRFRFYTCFMQPTPPKGTL